MINANVDLLKLWDRVVGTLTGVRRRTQIEYHGRLITIISTFRLVDYAKNVGSSNTSADRQKVVSTDMNNLLNEEQYLEKSSDELVSIIEREIQLRMPEVYLWLKLACLAHAEQFPKDDYLTINTMNPQYFSTTYIAGLAKHFPFLNQPIELIPSPSPEQFPTRAKLSHGLSDLLQRRFTSIDFPTDIRYRIGPLMGSPPDFVTANILSENDPEVKLIPTSWRPMAK
jgi:hypothetical protein